MSLWDSLKEQYYLLRQRQKFREFHGYRLDLENPRSFNEKIVWRKVFDRNPLFSILLDKFKSREYVVERLGKKVGGEILVPLLFATEDPESIPFEDLPEEYIIKPNHGSGWSIIVDGDHQMSREKIVSKCRKWMKKTYGQGKMEWAYAGIKPIIMVEKLLKDSQGKLVSDFKFHVFRGRVEWVFVMHDRFGSPSAARYLRDFSKMKFVHTSYGRAEDIKKPENFEKMVEIAEKLAQNFDYIRVDMYNVSGAIFFGEFTIYQASGFSKMESEMDFSMGERWGLERRFKRDFRPWFQKTLKTN